jgi:hypothetical protein
MTLSVATGGVTGGCCGPASSFAVTRR